MTGGRGSATQCSLSRVLVAEKPEYLVQLRDLKEPADSGLRPRNCENAPLPHHLHQRDEDAKSRTIKKLNGLHVHDDAARAIGNVRLQRGLEGRRSRSVEAAL
jgi:hypothetical protein